MRWSLTLFSLTTILSILSGLGQRTVAQVYPDCPAPMANEYLLLVRGSGEEDRGRISALLPADNPVLVCSYLDELVVRAGGFESLEAVNAWAVYLKDIEGYEAFVASPQIADGQDTNAPTEGSAAAPSATSDSSEAVADLPAYNPVALPSGYAILVDYQNQPETASAVQQHLLSAPVGLAIYQDQPYLLAAFHRDGNAATSVLQRLNEAEFSAILVEAQRVVRLTDQVELD